MEGTDIKAAIKDICETFVAYLESNLIKDQNKKTKNTLSGNSNLFEWTWPGEGSMADISENQDQNVIWNFFHEFSLESGWALKSKQKYGKKGGNVNKSKRFTAATMLENPRRKVEEEELDKKEIPKLQTI
ncbi:hypothetical protein RhiirA1_401432 [Rhizophagus irregularis]|uniref:Uncharacterized protein n=2 Tax=Rhizophagus irregularis TaxID=588596 RepID=A0A2I1F8Z1_9GLOM|nr:hypothetical protein GLOIN_2v1476303 [Rhizophagus irregularis DAOM 181602=DAOM 197198]PKC57403.1 hypothetical protein RhiirA1_401432 [Rhizophagus irregularis]PKY30834.1 hypothetical protein RhiirB3_392870 [Rhizophagus irregularis]POG74314.1 hypothetical protein GLOIN_2v1476303 [Rhizophagus irregularis DAOM 181602=DAOM 197198]|eukprot:XP_025181180.1 hypothetical protein GLOIN_2v1476303 [Rhizophagus irregularis DAOM 181602=DAOM 197198]